MTPSLPAPPKDLLDSARPWPGGGSVAPALELEAWVQSEILAENRPLSNYDHEHLTARTGDTPPRIAWLWCTEPYTKARTVVLGTCQLGQPRGNAWSAVRQRHQLEAWYQEIPDFLITLDAVFVAHCLRMDQTASALAVIEHELYHCARKLDRDGEPAYTPDGDPVWTTRPHDIEEFAGVYRRYGASTPGTQSFVAAVEHVQAHGPDVAPATIEGLCGTCRASIGPTHAIA